MWDGREPSLTSQAFDATQGHAQAGPGVPDLAQVSEIVAFESAIIDAQVFDWEAGPLYDDGATGGPAALSQQPFFIGINDSLSPGFDRSVFTLYDAWQNNPNPDRASVARGEAIFNTLKFTIHAVQWPQLVLNRFTRRQRRNGHLYDVSRFAKYRQSLEEARSQYRRGRRSPACPRCFWLTLIYRQLHRHKRPARRAASVVGNASSGKRILWTATIRLSVVRSI
jgi:hypothetical protein